MNDSGDLAHRGVEHGAIARQLLDRFGRERLGRLRGLVANRDLVDDDAIDREALVVDGGLRNLLRDQHAFDDAREDRVIAVEARLIGDGDEELRAGAVGLAGNLRGRHGAARVLFVR